MGHPNKRILISNAFSQRLVHQWRRQETAILVGTNTALLDNPKLNNRFWQGRQPLRLVIDRQLRLPKHLKLFDGTLPTWVFTTQTNTPDWGEQVRFVTLANNDHFLPQLLSYLHQEKIQSVLVEGGRQVLESFLEANIWDEAYVLEGSGVVGAGVKAPVIARKYHQYTRQLLDNTLFYYYNEPKSN